MISRISLLLVGALAGLFLSLSLGVSSAQISIPPADPTADPAPDPSDGIAPIESLLGDPAEMTVVQRYEMSATLLSTAMRGMKHLKFHMHFDQDSGVISIHPDESHGLPSPYPDKPAPDPVEPDTSEEF